MHKYVFETDLILLAGGKCSVLAGLIGIGVVGLLKMVQYIQKKMHVSGRWRSILIL